MRAVGRAGAGRPGGAVARRLGPLRGRSSAPRRAGTVLVPDGLAQDPGPGRARIVVRGPVRGAGAGDRSSSSPSRPGPGRRSHGSARPRLLARARTSASGRSPCWAGMSAWATGVRLAEGVSLGDGVSVGEDTVIGPRVVCYPGARIGSRVVLKAGAVIGGDGFGYLSGARRARPDPARRRVYPRGRRGDRLQLLRRSGQPRRHRHRPGNQARQPGARGTQRPHRGALPAHGRGRDRGEHADRERRDPGGTRRGHRPSA